MGDYMRVIPRDLFNDGNLLKCYGQLYLELELMGLESCLIHEPDGAFDIAQNENSGCTFVTNVNLIINDVEVPLWRPMNSRLAYPLYASTEDGEDIQVFNDFGNMTVDMKHLINKLRGD